MYNIVCGLVVNSVALQEIVITWKENAPFQLTCDNIGNIMINIKQHL